MVFHMAYMEDTLVAKRPTYEQLEQRVKELEKEALERKQTEEETKERGEELSALNAIATIVSQSLNLEEVLNGALDKVLELMDLSAGGIYLADPVRRKLELTVHRGISKEFAHDVGSINVDENTLEAVVAEGKLMRFVLSAKQLLKDRVQLKRILSAMNKEGVSLDSFAPVLLQAKEEILGLMIVASRVARRFSERELELLTSIAQQIATGIANARLYDAGQRELAERKQAEEALRESEEKYRSLVESTEDSIYLVDRECRYLFVNEKHLSRFGLPLDKVIGRPYAEFHSEEETKEFDKKVKRVFETGTSLSYEYRSQRHGGYFIRTLSPIKEPDARVSAVTVVSKDITARKQAEEKIQASLKEKEVLLREIHHRVKNNMQVISSLLNLQSMHIKDKEALEMFKESQDRIRAMSLIHEKLYRSEDLARIEFSDYVRDLTRHIFTTYRAISPLVSLDTDIGDTLLDITTAIPCGLIINELVSNSLRHAFPEARKGKITITLHSPKTNDYKLIVSDDGIGIPEDMDIRKTESLGLQLVTILAEDQLQGQISLDRAKGTTFQITWRAPQWQRQP